MHDAHVNNQKLDNSWRKPGYRLNAPGYEVTNELVQDLANFINEKIAQNGGQWITLHDNMMLEFGVPNEELTGWRGTYTEALNQAQRQGLIVWGSKGQAGRRFLDISKFVDLRK